MEEDGQQQWGNHVYYQQQGALDLFSFLPSAVVAGNVYHLYSDGSAGRRMVMRAVAAGPTEEEGGAAVAGVNDDDDPPPKKLIVMPSMNDEGEDGGKDGSGDAGASDGGNNTTADNEGKADASKKKAEEAKGEEGGEGVALNEASMGLISRLILSEMRKELMVEISTMRRTLDFLVYAISNQREDMRAMKQESEESERAYQFMLAENNRLRKRQMERVELRAEINEQRLGVLHHQGEALALQQQEILSQQVRILQALERFSLSGAI